jgi:threonine dehydrogenase-like Zn-dependent dehydrogenase
MLALHLSNQKLSIVERPVPTPPPGEALVRVLRAGICNTDLELTRGYYPYTGILGHEFVGVVETPGDWRGRRVCGEHPKAADTLGINVFFVCYTNVILGGCWRRWAVVT